MRLAHDEYAKLTAALRALPPEAWSRPTCNTGWDVTDVVRHTVGMTHLAASMREQLIQMRAAGRRPGPLIDNLTAVQVERNAHLDRPALIERLAELGPKAARARRRAPGFLRRRTMSDEQPVSPTESEKWTFGYLLDTILTRDPWTHRSDIALATGTAMEVTAEHDGLLVADVARDWASRHDQPYELELTGPAGGSWRRGEGGERIEMDAIEFCRVLSGRGSGAGLLQVRVPF